MYTIMPSIISLVLILYCCHYQPVSAWSLPVWTFRKAAARLFSSTTPSQTSTISTSTAASDTETATDAKNEKRRRVVLSKKKRNSGQINGDIDMDDDSKSANVISRTVPITPDWNLTVYEWEKTAAIVETYWQVHQQGLQLTSNTQNNGSNSKKCKVLDPFGLVCWPGAVVAAQELIMLQQDQQEQQQQQEWTVKDKNILILGAGVGIEAQAVAKMGARSVLATDIHPNTLQLLEYGAQQANLDHIITTQLFDITSPDQALPTLDSINSSNNITNSSNSSINTYFDLIIMADILYNEHLGNHVLRRCVEAKMNNHTKILIADSQRFVANLDERLHKELIKHNISSSSNKRVRWIPRWLPDFTGSGVMIDSDQTYDVKARVMWVE